MKEQIKNKLDNNLFGLKSFFEEEKINPELLSNLNSAFELSVRLDVINKIIKVIEKNKSYIFSNRNNCEYTQGQLRALDDLKEEIEDDRT